MPEIINLTPFPNFRYYSRDNRDQEFGIVVVKATFEFNEFGRFAIAEEQAPMVFTDKCHGAVNVTSLWHPSDLVPHKPATDIIVNAVAHAPGGQPAPSWQCGIEISNNERKLVSKKIRVTGEREWVPKWKRPLRESESAEWPRHTKYFDKWELSDPRPISNLPLRYEYAFGGEIETGTDDDGNKLHDTDEHNPLGRGKIDPRWTNHTQAVPAPQIEAAEDPITEPYKIYSPQNFGPIPPAWLPRLPLGGTYDDDWHKEVWPAWPKDYSFAYHNSAPSGLVISPHLCGGELVVLEGLAKGGEEKQFNLPDIQMGVEFLGDDERIVRKSMLMDTVFLDFGSHDPRNWRVFITWRVVFEPDRFSQLVIHRMSRTEALNGLNVQTKEEVPA